MDEIDLYLKEDLNEIGDITSDSIFTDETADAQIITKNRCILAGIEETQKIFEKTGANTKPLFSDGDEVDKNCIIAEINGSIRSILKGERLALNMLGKMSGIATETNKLVKTCKKHNSNIQIAATRKTTPGFRKFEKKAVEIGGGYAHRFGLFDEVMIKDNHIKKTGGIKKAIKLTKNKIKNKIIEVEIENINDAITAAKFNVDVIMIDNLGPKKSEIISKKIREINRNIIVEISGNVTPQNIIKYASFADRISLGCLTHSVKNIDFSLNVI